jgi:hypothetical protein
MLDFDTVNGLLSELTLLKFFPSETPARIALAKLVAGMASTHEQVEWLVTRTLSLCNEWPGPKVLRQIFCSKFKPADGISVGPTEMFPDGLPPERPIQPPARPALPPGHVATFDAVLDKAVWEAAAEKDINKLTLYTPPPDDAHLEEWRRARMRRQHREIMEAQGLKGMTEDIDRAVEEARAKKRRHDESGTAYREVHTRQNQLPRVPSTLVH